eukprot:6325151-Amphidinium_carterae.5
MPYLSKDLQWYYELIYAAIQQYARIEEHLYANTGSSRAKAGKIGQKHKQHKNKERSRFQRPGHQVRACYDDSNKLVRCCLLCGAHSGLRNKLLKFICCAAPDKGGLQKQQLGQLSRIH